MSEPDPPLTAFIRADSGCLRDFSEDMLIEAFKRASRPAPRCGSPERPHMLTSTQQRGDNSPYANCCHCFGIVQVRPFRPGEARGLYREFLRFIR
jgi:hypothetical protein